MAMKEMKKRLTQAVNIDKIKSAVTRSLSILTRTDSLKLL